MSSKNPNVPAALKVFVLAILVGSLQAQVEPDRSGVGQAEFRASELNIETRYRLPNELPGQAASDAAADLAALGLSANAGQVDVRSGRWATLMLSEPLVPGRGKGNNLNWTDLGQAEPKTDAELANAALQEFRWFLQAASQEFRIDTAELGYPGKTTVHGDGSSIQIYIPRVFNGVKVRGNYLTATINHGNLTLFGASNWGDINTSVVPSITESAALEAVQSHVGSYTINGSWRSSELELIPVARGQNPKLVAVGQGYDYRLAWVIRPAFDGDMRHFEALVDAHGGELLSFEDTNQYVASLRRVQGGVYPVSNDGISPDGVEQAGSPMPYDNVSTPSGTVTTDSGGNLPAPVDGNITSNLSGPYVHINDNCGAISLTSTGDVDFGTSGGTDCTTPGFGGAGNTHASRTGFHELNRIIEMGRSHLPTNSWLQQQLTANMNINLTCNAFWGGGTVNFYRSGGGCFNTGELAGVFDHEWGHGLDDNDAFPTIAGPSGEGIADIYTALRLNSSCIGRNFRSTNCSGFGDPCLNCTGVRDIDYLKRQSGQPHDYSWSNANCGGSVHCVGSVYAEAVWSLWKRELQGPPYNMDNNTAHEVVNRMTYIGAGNVSTWFSGGPSNGGCAAGSGYMNYLAADDDNGDLADGTPHMQAIFDAFDDQEIACGTPTVQDSGCAGSPTTAPTLAAAPLDKSVSLSWNAVTGASSYEVFRTEGVFACDFGKVKVAETTGTTFDDAGLQNGREYSYVVIPKGASAACFGPASNCASDSPVAGPNIDVDASSASLAFLSGDGDTFVDNCEDASLTFDVVNTGIGSLTNVRITGVTVVSHPATTVTTTFPAAVSPSTLAEGAAGSGSFDFTGGGLTFGDTLEFEVSFTADEISPLEKTQILSFTNAESDLQFVASQTWDFETDLDGWTLIQGTFNQTTTGGGAGGSSGYVASSAFLDDQCDQVRSPIFQLTDTSTMTLQNNYAIEAFSGQWWDRANIAVLEGGVRNAVDPDGGRLYNASGPGATCATNGQDGWADVNNGWGSSSWSATALDSVSRAGTAIQLDVAYGTDELVNGKGFWFDQVTVTDIEFLVADTQSDDCDTSCTVDADCDNGLFCDGVETCNAGQCQAGTVVDCDDSVSCTDDSCNETTDTCDNVANNGNCDDGAFCNGDETCDVVNDCQAGTPPSIDDGVACTNDSCDEASDTIINTPDDGICDNGLFCDGDETCDAVLDCQAGSDPCAGGACNETSDICEGAGSVHVASVLTGTVNVGRGFKLGTATVTLADNLGNPVGADFVVTGNFSGSFNEQAIDSTNSSGVADFQTISDPQKGVTVFFCVSDVDGSGASPALAYADGDNAPGTTCGPPPVCGDGDIESPEVCDGTNLGGETCVSLGYDSGTLACDILCLIFDTSGCIGEQCIATHNKEKGPRCSDGLDNDCDGMIDSADPDC